MNPHTVEVVADCGHVVTIPAREETEPRVLCDVCQNTSKFGEGTDDAGASVRDGAIPRRLNRESVPAPISKDAA